VAGRGAGMLVLEAPACPPMKLGPSSHTGGPKTSVPKNCFFTNLIQIAIHIYIFMKYRYYIVYTNK
jgi:hypothetical protein